MSAAGADALIAGMLGAVGAYRQGHLHLGRLTWELKARIAAIREHSDPEWADALKEAWNGLELANALYLDSGLPSPAAEHRQMAETALRELEARISRRPAGT
ncbi:MAG: hypothetical protein ACRD2F_02100 [Terriglobales bacterium]